MGRSTGRRLPIGHPLAGVAGHRFSIDSVAALRSLSGTRCRQRDRLTPPAALLGAAAIVLIALVNVAELRPVTGPLTSEAGRSQK
jgi:hypothetical protein